MDKTFPAAAPENPKEMEAAIQQMFAEMDRADVRIQRTQKRINKLKTELRTSRENARAS